MLTILILNMSKELEEKKAQLEQELQKVNDELRAKQEKIAKEALAELNKLQTQIVALAKQYNQKAEAAGVHSGLAVLYGEPGDDYDSCHYLVKGDGRGFWFPSTQVC
jgi:lipid II:glycine glycyltransferase (peptidoglycan interpeptide bridge formation enzyme)